MERVDYTHFADIHRVDNEVLMRNDLLKVDVSNVLLFTFTNSFGTLINEYQNELKKEFEDCMGDIDFSQN